MLKCTSACLRLKGLELTALLQEVAMLQSLNHDSNVVQFLGACISRDSRQAFMVLEYMEVSSLGMAAWLMQNAQGGWQWRHAVLGWSGGADHCSSTQPSRSELVACLTAWAQLCATVPLLSVSIVGRNVSCVC